MAKEAKNKKSKDKVEEQKVDLESQSPKTDVKDIELLVSKNKILELEKELKEFKEGLEKKEKELNQKFLEVIDKKSKDVAKILEIKQLEIEQKLHSEFEHKKNFLYESQLTELVEIVVQFEKIMKADVKNPEIKNYLIGFQMFVAQFKNLFSAFGITESTPEVGGVFDSEIMSAAKTESAGPDQVNKVLEVYSSAFFLNERVIKIAEVKVGI